MTKAVEKTVQYAPWRVGEGEAPAEPIRQKLGRSLALPLVFRSPASLPLACLVLMLSAIGCSGSSSGYPDVAITSELGTSAVCHQCGRPIPTVSATHIVEQGSARYVVCTEKCKGDILKWHASQNGGVSKQ